MLILPLWKFFLGTWYTASVPDLHDGSIDSFAFGVKNLKIWPFLFFLPLSWHFGHLPKQPEIHLAFQYDCLGPIFEFFVWGKCVVFRGKRLCTIFLMAQNLYTNLKKGPSMSFVVYSPQLDRPYFDGLFLGCCGFDAVDISCKFFAHIIIGEGMRSICKISNIVSPQYFLQNVMSLLYTVLFIF